MGPDALILVFRILSFNPTFSLSTFTFIIAACRNGRPNACEFNETLGVQRDGAMREFFVIPWQKVIVTEGLSTRDCA